MEIPTDSIEAAQAYISEHFYLCLIDKHAMVYMYSNRNFILMTTHACKELYLRTALLISPPMCGLLWSPQQWFFDTAPVHFVVTDSTQPRTFVVAGQLMLNLHVPPAFHSFSAAVQYQTLNDLQYITSSLRCAYLTGIPPNPKIRHPLCMRSALAEDIHRPSEKQMLLLYIANNYKNLEYRSLNYLNLEAGTKVTKDEMAFMPHVAKLDGDIWLNCAEDELKIYLKFF